MDLASSPLWINLAVFLAGAGAISLGGMRLAALGDRLADRTGLGEALTGTLFLGLLTALPGLSASVAAALEGRPALAIGNALGGIAVQTTFLAAADVFHRKANLEHAAASVTNMLLTVTLVLLLALVLAGLSGPRAEGSPVHPVTGLLVLAAGGGFWLAYRSRVRPMWKPRRTVATVEDVPDEAYERSSLARLLGGFLFHGALVTAAGAAVAHTTGNIAEASGMSETVAGGLFSGVATSLPELFTTVGAVRQGALTLAVSDIVGGNFFDVLFLAAADAAYLRGSLYHAPGVGARETFLATLCVLLNVMLLLGLLFRQREGPGNIGFESVLMVVIYAAGFLILGLWM